MRQPATEGRNGNANTRAGDKSLHYSVLYRGGWRGSPNAVVAWLSPHFAIVQLVRLEGMQGKQTKKNNTYSSRYGAAAI